MSLRSLTITLALAAIASAQSPSQVESVWVELGAEGKIIARAITKQPQCPAITLAGAPRSMQVRAIAKSDYPVRACEFVIPPDVAFAAIAGIPLPLPKKEPRTIAVLGDTGCRLKDDSVQACNDPAAWPFPAVAARIASMHPDLVVHVGDYLYRETACPPGDNCAGPHGENWDVWNADFFAPAAPLLRAAPWVLVRGNHEDCHRAGEGWFRFLDAGPRPDKCAEIVEPFRVPAGTGLDLLVLDVSRGKDPVSNADLQIDKLQKLAHADSWIVMHRPIWWQRTSRAGDDGGRKEDAPVLPDAVQLVLSGHVHSFGALSFKNGQRPAQLIAGDAGTSLDTKSILSGANGAVYGEPFEAQEWKGQFGFAMFEKTAAGWQATGYDPNGKAFAACKLTGKSLSCQKP
jgi:hypothetical protein